MRKNLAAFALALALLPSAVARAQVPSPPGTYTVAVSLEEALTPLIAAAEADVGAGRHALAQARARLVLAALPEGTALRVRAQGVELLATQALAAPDAPPPEAPPPEAVLEPLVAAAEQSVQRAEPAMAIVRLDFTLQRLPEGTALGVRAAAVRQVAQARLAPPPAATPPPGAYPPAAYGGYVQPAPPPPPPGRRRRDEPPGDPNEPGTGEYIEMYTMTAAFGVFTGFYIPWAAGVRDSGSGTGGRASEANLAYSLGMIGGGAAFALSAMGLHLAGMRTGQPGSIAIGFRWGTIAGMLGFLSAIDYGFGGPRLDDAERMSIWWGLGMTGGVLGTVLGYATEPSTDDVRFVECGAIWGTGYGALLASTVVTALDPDLRDPSLGFGLTLGGTLAGIATTSILAGTGVHIPSRRAWLLTLGYVIGTAAATVVTAVAFSITREFSPIVLGTLGIALSTTGLVVTALLTDGWTRDGEDAAAPDVSLSVSPMPGGGLASAAVGF